MPLMTTHHPILTSHRLQRYVLWALALVSWVAATAFANRPISARRARRFGDVSWLDLSHLVGNLIMIRALHMLGRVPPLRRFPYWLRELGARPSHFRRSLFGAKLRRALRHKDPAMHLAQLIAVLRSFDTHAARLARNIRRRRRLLRLVPAIAPAALILGPPASSPAFPDSS